MLVLPIGALNPPTFDDVPLTVFASQKDLAPGPFPTGRAMVAHASWRSVQAVAPEIFPEVLPQYAALREDAWTRLLAHELSHSWIPWLRDR